MNISAINKENRRQKPSVWNELFRVRLIKFKLRKDSVNN